MINLTNEALKKLGVHEYGVILTKDIEFCSDIQDICKNNVCRVYGKTWACPPAIGGIDECRARCNKYDNAFVFTAKYDLEDSFDYEGMEAAGDDFRQLCDRLYQAVGGDGESCMLLANGGCKRCVECTYPNAPCVMPEKLFRALEGHGILVSDIAKKAGVKYYNGTDTVTYFGVVFY